ncbi:MAG: hypothetical protein ACRENI_13885 [Gemmatimonadaceae bacterium]
MSERERRGLAAAEFHYRRRLGARDLLPAVGAGIAAGSAAFYVACLFLQRTPLVREARVMPPVAPVRAHARGPRHA